MGRILGLVVGLSLLVCRSSSPATEQPPAPLPVERLIEQLGDPDYRVRDAASRALANLGPGVLPALRKAQSHSDPEVRRRLELLIPPLERAVMLAPRRVSLRLSQVPVREAVAAISQQTGYRIDLFPPAASNGEREKMLASFHFDNLPFWEAMERLCAEGGLTVQEGYGNDSVRLQFDDNRTPFVHVHGPFRLVAHGFHYSRSVHFQNLPRHGPFLGHRSEHLNFTLGISVEPRLPLLGLGQVKLDLAIDERNQSMLPPENFNGLSHHYYHGGYKSLNLQANVNLVRASRDSECARRLQGVLPVNLLIEQRPDLTVEQVLQAKGKKFKADDVELDFEDISEGPNKVYQVKMTVRRTGQNHANDYTWSNSLYQRLELCDAKGNKYQPRGYGQANFSPTSVSGTFQFGDPGNGQVGPPVKLVYYTWITLQHPVAFEFRDLPLP
jgi:hypothetical protein